MYEVLCARVSALLSTTVPSIYRKLDGRKIFHGQCREIVYNFLENENDQTISAKEAVKRIPKATGVNDSTIWRIIKESKMTEGGNSSFPIPNKDAIRRMINSFYTVEKMRPTLMNLHDKADYELNFKCSLSLFRR